MREQDFLSAQVFYVKYFRTLSERDLRGWVECFTPDADYRVISAENAEAGLPLSLFDCHGQAGMRDRVFAIEEALVFRPVRQRHLFSITDVETGEGVLRCRGDMAVIRTGDLEAPELALSAEFTDVLTTAKDGRRLRSRRVVYDGSMISRSLIYPV